MGRVASFLKKEPMLTVAVAAAVISLFITPPSPQLIKEIDWKTLATLFMMLTVLEGFKKEDIFRPLIRFTSKMTTMFTLSLFLVFSVFFSSMFVTNDVSLIIFVPLTIMLFRMGGKEKYILPVITFENIAAVRGSLLMPFGSPQNLFIFAKSGMSAGRFIGIMSPLCVMSGILLVLYIFLLYRRNPKEKTDCSFESEKEKNGNIKLKALYLILFAGIVTTIVTRTALWPYVTAAVALAVLVFDRKILIKTDYVLLLTFLCFFVFSSSICANPTISQFLTKTVAGHEYACSILLSQVISNVPAAIVLYPFSKNIPSLLYGLDSAGLCSLIGSLASVINYRIYVREYPENGGKFIKTFTLISLSFFAIVVIPGYLIGRLFA